MKFRARLISSASIINVLNALKQLGSMCLLNMTPSSWNFYMIGEYASGEQAFAELKVNAVFESYRIGSRASDMIPLQIDLQNLIRALQSANTAHKITVDLTKKAGQVYLSFAICTDPGREDIVQDVPVDVQPPERILDCREPDIVPSSIRIKLPNLKMLKNVIEKMRTIDDRLRIKMTSDGDAIFSARNDIVNITTSYYDIKYVARYSNVEEDSEKSSVDGIVDTRKLAKMLCSHSLEPALVVSCIAEHEWFVVYEQIGQDIGTLTYYIPLIPEEFC